MTHLDPSQAPSSSAWPHRLAVLLVCATMALICVGGVVTTLGAGMAFRDWPTSDGHNMLLYPWWKSAGDKFVEHGHRLLGATVGLITIALVVSLWLTDRRRWIGWLGVLALVLVIAQGILGGMRVRADAIQLAKIHGCVGPAFFALTVALAALTSKAWRAGATWEAASAGRFHRLAIFTTVLAYVQLLLGAQLRHIAPQASSEAFRLPLLFHLLVAFALVVHCLLLLRATIRLRSRSEELLLPAVALVLLVLVQVLLGGASWVFKYSWPAEILGHSRIVAGWLNTAGGVGQSLVVTSHVAVGSAILGTALLVTLRGLRLVRSAAVPGVLGLSVMEAAR